MLLFDYWLKFVQQNTGMMPYSPLPQTELTPFADLKTWVENRTIFNLSHCELNLFETYEKSENVGLKFSDLVVTSMLRGKKIMHLSEREGFSYLPGETVIVPANEPMQIDFPEAELYNPTQCIALAIDFEKIDKTLELLNEKYANKSDSKEWALDYSHLYFRNNAEINDLLDKLIRICRSDDLFKDALADLALQELLVKIIQLQTLNSSGDQTKTTHPTLLFVLEKIKKEMYQKINLQAIASEVGWSISTMYRIFKQELGISPIEFILLEKIKRAKRHLKDNSLFIKNIAYEVGFEDANYFNRMFKKLEGITPLQYRKLHYKEGEGE